MAQYLPDTHHQFMRMLSVRSSNQGSQLSVQPNGNVSDELTGLAIDKLGNTIQSERSELLSFGADTPHGLNAHFTEAAVPPQGLQDQNISSFTSVLPTGVDDFCRDAQRAGEDHHFFGCDFGRGDSLGFLTFLGSDGKRWCRPVCLIMGIVVLGEPISHADVMQDGVNICGYGHLQRAWLFLKKRFSHTVGQPSEDCDGDKCRNHKHIESPMGAVDTPMVESGAVGAMGHGVAPAVRGGVTA